MGAPNETPEAVECTSCGRQTPGANEHGWCERCAEKMEGYNEGEAEAAELMLHLAVAGAREIMGEADVRRVFEFVMGGGETMYRVRGVA